MLPNNFKIISGAQDGADIAALRAAFKSGIATGGYITKDARIKSGTLTPETVAMYNLQKISTTKYADRTKENVLAADATVRFAYDFDSRGELCTLKYIKAFHKPYNDVYLQQLDDGSYGPFYSIATPEWMASWIATFNPTILNVAGNADKTIEPFVENFITQMLSYMKG